MHTVQILDTNYELSYICNHAQYIMCIMQLCVHSMHCKLLLGYWLSYQCVSFMYGNMCLLIM